MEHKVIINHKLPEVSSGRFQSGYLLILAFLIFIFCISCNSTQQKDEGKIEFSNHVYPQIDSICNSFIAAGNIVGFSVAIAHHGKNIFAKGYGLANLESKIPATEKTIYPIASISKFITAVSTMKLVEAAKISLEDKVISYFSDFPRRPNMDEITIEHLLRHQSGLADHEDWFDSIYINERRVFTSAEFFQFIDQPLFFRPGSHYSYSNSGYAVLSMILEKVTGLTFHDMITEYIGKPTNIQSLGMWPQMWSKQQASMGYELNGEEVDTSFHMMTRAMKGDGGLSASVEDLVKFADALVEGKLITQNGLDKMISPTDLGSFTIDYGLGLKFGKIGDHNTWGHSGGYKGTGWAILAHYPESGYTFATAMNTNYSPEEAWTIRHKIMPLLLGIPIPEMDTSGIEHIELYPGEYATINRWGYATQSVRVVSVQDKRLIWDNPETDIPGAQLFPIGTHRFTWKMYPFDEFKFHLVNDKVAACSEYIDGFFVGIRMKK